MNEYLAAQHPFIVHFAVSISIIAALFDLLSLYRREKFGPVSFALIIVSSPFLISAVLTGNLAQQFLQRPEARAIVEQHESLATAGMWILTAASVLRIFLVVKKNFMGWKRIAYLLGIVAGAVLIFIAARKGGTIFHADHMLKHSLFPASNLVHWSKRSQYK